MCDIPFLFMLSFKSTLHHHFTFSNTFHLCINLLLIYTYLFHPPYNCHAHFVMFFSNVSSHLTIETPTLFTLTVYILHKYQINWLFISYLSHHLHCCTLPDKRCLSHGMCLCQVVMTLHFSNDVANDAESAHKSKITS